MKTRRSRFRFGPHARRGEVWGLAGDSGYVAIWQGASSVADLAQIALITHQLGLSEYGRFALVVAAVMLIDQFFDVRVGAAATTFGARRLRGGAHAAAGIFQLSYLVDAATGVLALVVVGGASVLLGPRLIGHDGTALMLLYSLVLLCGTLDDSSLAILRLFGRFRLISGYTVALEGLRIVLIVTALTVANSIAAIIVALAIYRLATGIVNVTAAFAVFRRQAGVSLTRPALDSVRDDRKSMLEMIFHTNIVSYARLTQTQLPAVVLGVVSTTTQVGVYKVGMAAAAAVGRITDPAYIAVLPRLSRLWSAGERSDLRRLVKRASLIAATAMTVAVGAAVLFRGTLIDILGGPSTPDSAEAVLVLGSVALAVNGALFWNNGILFVAGKSRAVAVIAMVGVAVQVGLLIPLATVADAIGAAIAFFASMVVTNALVTVLAMRVLRTTEPFVARDKMAQTVASSGSAQQ